MRSKKGAELALNFVIIAVIALLILVVVLFIFWNKGASPFTEGVSGCTSLGGECKEIECSKLTPPKPSLFASCEVAEGEPKQFCCAK
ncbi:TPA: hypothetical protein HA219_00710 [Candidatus Woesearchaeota archaeon]|nr:hypothetical protein [Candidatus Woesearchaeota archaeon]HIH39234.1 hypothetical protein [Candidatus Woesearchaeota archaeon]